jgi:hypothetical protein
MNFKPSKICKEGNLRAWSFEDIMLGVEKAELSKGLPVVLKLLICNMSIGFHVHCLGACEAEFDKNGIQNRRDLNCLIQKFSLVPPGREDWTCWPCLDFLRKFKPKLWKQRAGLEFRYNSAKKPQRFEKAHSLKIGNFEIGDKEKKCPVDVTNTFVIKFGFGEINITQDATRHNCFHS